MTALGVPSDAAATFDAGRHRTDLHQHQLGTTSPTPGSPEACTEGDMMMLGGLAHPYDGHALRIHTRAERARDAHKRLAPGDRL